MISLQLTTVEHGIKHASPLQRTQVRTRSLTSQAQEHHKRKEAAGNTIQYAGHKQWRPNKRTGGRVWPPMFVCAWLVVGDLRYDFRAGGATSGDMVATSEDLKASLPEGLIIAVLA